MVSSNPLSEFSIGQLLDSIILDFVLAFALFTALIYGVLSRRFEHQRAAVAMSAALGLAMAVGLVAWEQERGLSVRNLGPVAIGFALIILGIVLYNAIRQVGGGWAGGAIALGASLLFGLMLGLGSSYDQQLIGMLVVIFLTLGVMVFLLHAHGNQMRPATDGWTSDITDVLQDAGISERHQKRHQRSKRKQKREESRRRDVATFECSEGASDILLQLRRMLPDEGRLTKRLAQLRARAHHVREGHVARIKECRGAISGLPADAIRGISQELTTQYRQLKFDARVERLDQAVASCERKIRQLKHLAQRQSRDHDQQGLFETFKAAETQQRHNSRLISIIDRSERKLVELVNQVARTAQRSE